MAQRTTEPDVLRGIGILFVAAIHAFAYLHLPTEGGWAAPRFAVQQIAVPIFFFADFWLLARRFPHGVAPGATRAYLLNSTRRLMLPWAIFSLLYLATRLAGERTGLLGGAPVLTGPASLPAALWHGAAAGQLYFLPALLMVRAAGVLLFRAAASPPRAWVLAALLFLAWRVLLERHIAPPDVGVEPVLAALTGLCFAALGWAVALSAPRAPMLATAALALAALAAQTIDERTAMACWQIAYLLAVWIAITRLPDNPLQRAAAWLGRHTMEIYLLHAPIAVKLISDILLRLHVPNAAALLLAVAGCVAASLAVAALMRRLGLAWTWGEARRA